MLSTKSPQKSVLEKNQPSTEPMTQTKPSSSINNTLTDELSNISLHKRSPMSSTNSQGAPKPPSGFCFNSKTSQKVAMESAGMDLGVSLNGEKLHPPPISCLKLFREGKPYMYLDYDRVLRGYVVKEIRIPSLSMFHAVRENGRLRLYFANQDHREDEADEEEEKNTEAEEENQENHCCRIA